MMEKIIIFTRYPEPGKTKTRLMPFLGAVEAANLHQKMTEHTLKNVRKLSLLRPNLLVEVCFVGGDLQLFQNWLGADLFYQEQGEGDLGDRLLKAAADSFNQGIEKVVIIGTDCPDLDVNFLSQSFDNLAQNNSPLHDLVLGEAIDGGYYLIGLKRSIPELFTGISWGTNKVLQQTLTIADQLNLSVKILPPLADIDRPEDMVIWQKYLQ